MADDKAAETQWTILKALTWTQSHFKTLDIDSPRLTAELLLCHSLGIRRLDLYLQFDRPMQPGELTGYRELIKRRIRREPVAYITGSIGFWESRFAVTPGVLIPRSDTETLVEASLAVLAQSDTGRPGQKRVLEMGCGSGAVIISLAKSHPGHTYYATDISAEALAVSVGNATKNKIGQAIRFLQGSWLSPFKPGGTFHLIVSNPPYIPSKEIDTLQPEISGYEPRPALDGGPDGLDALEEIIASALEYLVPGGCLLLEIGSDQKEAVAGIAGRVQGYKDLEFFKDYPGHYRVVKLRTHTKTA